LVAAALMNELAGPRLNPTLRILISLSVLVFIAGLLASIALALISYWWGQRARFRHILALQRAATIQDRRRFLQRLDHELKNPLMAIRAALANFSDAPSARARHAALSSVESQTLRLSRLIGDLRKIAELETRPLERGPVDLTGLLREVIELAREKPEAASRHILLSVPQAPWPLPTISGDWDLIFLALYNLVENALKYTRSGDTVEIRAREDGPVVIIDVADTGPGIAGEDMPYVWEELYRGRGARGTAGSGLGLALVKAVAERHGGQVRVHSRPGRGTVFTFQIPA
jgi:two-component system OmpR family sensor kinase